MGGLTSKKRAPYNYTEAGHDLSYTLGGKWRLTGYEPEGCADIENCNADFMFLRYWVGVPDDSFAGFDTFLRLVDEETTAACGNLDANLTFVG